MKDICDYCHEEIDHECGEWTIRVTSDHNKNYHFHCLEKLIDEKNGYLH